MLGAIFGDIVGSTYEFNNTKDYNFKLLTKYSRPTDDSYMTLAVAKALMDTYENEQAFYRFLDASNNYDGSDCAGIPEYNPDMPIKPLPVSLVENMQDIGRRYPHAGYGGMFAQWLRAKDPKPYGSYGNGSGMRVSAVGWLYDTLEETLEMTEITAKVTHDHIEGIKGAQAVAAAIFLARAGASKEQIKAYIGEVFNYDLDRTLDDIRPNYSFDVTCQGSVPEAIIAFLEGKDYEDVIRKAVSFGGDSDTIACMAGGIAEVYFGMPEKFKEEALSRLDKPMRKIVHDFRKFVHEHTGKPVQPFFHNFVD